MFKSFLDKMSSLISYQDDHFYFKILVSTYPKDWENAHFNTLPIDSSGAPYSDWKEVYENYLTYIQAPRFQNAPQDIFDQMILFVPIEEMYNFFLKFCRFDKEQCAGNKNFWILLWKRDINDNPPLEFPDDMKGFYLNFVFNYNKEKDINNKLLLAANFGAIKLIPQLISQGANIYTAIGIPTYGVLIQRGDLDTLHFLISLGADKSGLSNGSLIHFAVEREHLDILKYLISLNVNLTEHSIESLIMTAIEKNYLEILKYLVSLLDIFPEIDKSYKLQIYLLTAAEKGLLDIVKYLVEEQGVDYSAQGNIAAKFAAKEGHLDVLKYLIGKGVDITDNKNGNILQYAIDGGNLSIVKYLVYLGIDLTKDYYIHLRYAKSIGKMEILTYLLSQVNQEEIPDIIMKKLTKGSR